MVIIPIGGFLTILENAKDVFRKEADAILSLIDRLNDDFIKAVSILQSCTGKVIVTGIGKSGIVSQKIASTLSCSGTPAFFLHPAEGVHGDSGMMAKEDVVIAVSNSGETDEVIKLLPLIKRKGIKLIVLTGNLDAVLSRSADVVLDVSVKEEACPLGLVPTSSTTAAVAMGDALALTLLERRGFNEEDFAVLHPGGTLGRKLLMRVEDLMHVKEAIPLVSEQDPMKVALIEMTSKRLGVTGVVNASGELMGIITDGDLRRGLEREGNLLALTARDVMTLHPKTIEKDALAATALQKMEHCSITSLFVIPETGLKKPEGIVHLHDILRAGIV
ncbi:MAG: KpsF/GutQ family sugar-phosphate isomerase [Proteobacteria bacterium]|nr:KpsF/GutQ family sugar-phosphate isomerase [Pseudomonadota bacterium]